MGVDGWRSCGHEDLCEDIFKIFVVIGNIAVDKVIGS